MKKKSKIIITSITTACLLLISSNREYHYVPRYSIIDFNDEDCFIAEYRYGKVYIVKNLENINNYDKNDIIIVDQRDGSNPNMRIISSYEIIDKEVRNDIIEIILDYENKYSSNWKRTKESMRLKWFVHNIFYDLNYQRDHTDNVDLDNNDEEKYNIKFLNKILKI